MSKCMLRPLSVALCASWSRAETCTFSYRNSTVFNSDGWGDCNAAQHVTTVTGVEVDVDSWWDDDLARGAQCYFPSQAAVSPLLAADTWPAGTDSVRIDCGVGEGGGGGDGSARALRLLRLLPVVIAIIAVIVAVCVCKQRKMFCFKQNELQAKGVA